MRRGAAASLLVLAVVVTGCAPAVDPAWVAPTWPAEQVRVLEAAPQPLDPATLPLTPQRIRSDGVQARMSYLPGTTGAAETLNTRIDDIVRAAAGAGYTPTVGEQGAGLGDRGCLRGSTLRPAAEVLADPALGPGDGVAVVCDVVAAAGDLLGQRIRVISGTADGVDSDTATVLYADTASGELVDGAELWTDGAGETLRDDIVEALRRDAGALGLAPIAPPDEAQAELIAAGLADTVPGNGGALVFTLPAGFSTPELTDLGVPATPDPMVIEVPADLVAQLASPFGQRVAAASTSPYTGPEAVPAGRDWVDCTLLPCVALTYDDGPSSLTGRLLDVFADAHAGATFYMLGQYASGNPDIVRRVADEGHIIGSHTWNHPSLPSLDDDEIRSQLTRTADLLRRISGQPVATFRPPYGEYNSRVLTAAGQPAILWSVDTRDWAGPPDDVLLTRAIDEPRPGGIVLFHDTHERSVRLAPDIIAGLRDRGFTPVTITQLFDGKLPAAGAWRSAG